MSTEKTILLPDIGDFKDVDVIEVAVGVGDKINVDDTLITLESDKSTMDIPSEESGEIIKMMVAAGDRVSPGDPIMVLNLQADSTQEPVAQKTEQAIQETSVSQEKSEKEPQTRSDSEPSKAQTHPQPTQASVDTKGAELLRASPAVRRVAREFGVDLSQVHGSGRHQRILKEDVQKFVRQRLNQPYTSDETAQVDIAALAAKFGEIDQQRLSRIRKIAGQHLSSSWRSIPHVTQFDEADITELESFRKSLAHQAEESKIKLTLLSFIIKAVVHCLQHFPRFNASLDGSGDILVLKKYYHIGVAVNTDDGLIVPVIRDVDQKGLLEIAQHLTELGIRARQGQIKADELQGGCFTISSLGGIGGAHFTPIINAPEAAILGVSRATTKPVYIQDEMRARLILPFALSYDHRIIDGVEGAQFSQFLAKTLADIRNLIL